MFLWPTDRSPLRVCGRLSCGEGGGGVEIFSGTRSRTMTSPDVYANYKKKIDTNAEQRPFLKSI